MGKDPTAALKAPLSHSQTRSYQELGAEEREGVPQHQAGPDVGLGVVQ